MSPHESPRPVNPDAEAATLAGNRETLTPARVRSLLRECVTVVKPGEVLVIRVPWDTSQRELREYGESLRRGTLPMRDPWKPSSSPRRN